MISLYESILSTVKSGKIAMIEKWCDENIKKSMSDENCYVITPEGKVDCKCLGESSLGRKSYMQITIDGNKKIPNYIKFADYLSMLKIDDSIKSLSKDQLPKYIYQLWLSGTEVPKLDIEIGYEFEIENTVKKINPLNITFASNENRSGSYNTFRIGSSELTEEEFRNIHITSKENPVYISISGDSKFAKTISKTVQKLKTESQNALDEYIKDLLKDKENVNMFEIRMRSKLLRIKKDQNDKFQLY